MGKSKKNSWGYYRNDDSVALRKKIQKIYNLDREIPIYLDGNEMTGLYLSFCVEQAEIDTAFHDTLLYKKANQAIINLGGMNCHYDGVVSHKDIIRFEFNLDRGNTFGFVIDDYQWWILVRNSDRVFPLDVACMWMHFHNWSWVNNGELFGAPGKELTLVSKESSVSVRDAMSNMITAVFKKHNKLYGMELWMQVAKDLREHFFNHLQHQHDAILQAGEKLSADLVPLLEKTRKLKEDHANVVATYHVDALELLKSM